MRLAASMLVLAMLALGPAVTGAQDRDMPPAGRQSAAGRDEAARAAFERGRQAFESGSFEEALVAFRRSYELSGRSPLLYNIGLAAEQLGRREEALSAYREYLAADPHADDRAEIEGRIASLRAATSARQATRRSAGEADPQRSVSPSRGSRRRPEPGPTDDRSRGGGVLGRWWFWTIVGVVAVGTGVTVAVLASGGGRQVEAPIRGTDGVVLEALGARF